jgi:hypothetical protein
MPLTSALSCAGPQPPGLPDSLGVLYSPVAFEQIGSVAGAAWVSADLMDSRCSTAILQQQQQQQQGAMQQ